MKTNFILPIGVFAILTTMPNIANAECSGGTNAGATCTVNSQCPGGKCVNVSGGGITPTFCTPETCKPTTTGWGSCGFGANSYVECEETAECVGSLCVRGTNYRCVAGAYGNPSASNKTACAPCPSPGTSAAGSTSQSDCYIPAGTTGSDSTGTYKYTANCYYLCISPKTTVPHFGGMLLLCVYGAPCP